MSVRFLLWAVIATGCGKPPDPPLKGLQPWSAAIERTKQLGCEATYPISSGAPLKYSCEKKLAPCGCLLRADLIGEPRGGKDVLYQMFVKVVNCPYSTADGPALAFIEPLAAEKARIGLREFVMQPRLERSDDEVAVRSVRQIEVFDDFTVRVDFGPNRKRPAWKLIEVAAGKQTPMSLLLHSNPVPELPCAE